MDRNRRSVMTLTKVMKLPGFALLMVVFWIGAERAVRPQFGPLLDPAYAPQAKSEEELDQYLKIMTDSDPQVTVADVQQFATLYPNSELLGLAFQYQMMAYRQLHDLNHVVEAGRKALKLQPNNVNTLLTLASAIAEGIGTKPATNVLRQQAEQCAYKALRELDQMRVPREIPLERWKEMRAAMESQAREALRELAVKKGKGKKE
jgi:tetratricopeptide (TPR) repeat protein